MRASLRLLSSAATSARKGLEHSYQCDDLGFHSEIFLLGFYLFLSGGESFVGRYESVSEALGLGGDVGFILMVRIVYVGVLYIYLSIALKNVTEQWNLPFFTSVSRNERNPLPPPSPHDSQHSP